MVISGFRLQALLQSGDAANRQVRIMRATMFYGRGVLKNQAVSDVDNDHAHIEDALQTQLAYDIKHGYTTAVLRQDLLGSVWSKPAWLLCIVIEELSKPIDQRKEWLM